MTYSLSCGDVLPGCAAKFDAESEDALLGQVADHAAVDHGVAAIPPALLAQVREAVTVS